MCPFFGELLEWDPQSTLSLVQILAKVLVIPEADSLQLLCADNPAHCWSTPSPWNISLPTSSIQCLGLAELSGMFVVSTTINFG